MQNEREGWNTEELTDQASQKDGDEIQRQIKRGDESKGDANERDYAGTVKSKDTPQGREEAKKQVEESGKSND